MLGNKDNLIRGFAPRINKPDISLTSSGKEKVTPEGEDNFSKSSLSEKVNVYNPRLFVENKTEANENNRASDSASLPPETPVSRSSQSALKTIHIIHTNDIHGNIAPLEVTKKQTPPAEPRGGLAYMGAIIKDIQKEAQGNYILLDGGDWAQGTYESGLTKGKTVIDVMNNMGYDAAEIGNHEFDWSQKALDDMAGRADFTVLGANLIRESSGILKDIKPYTIKEVNGVKVGIVGVITPETAEKAKPKNLEGIKFENPFDTVSKYIPELKDKGADLIIVLSHQGVGEDNKRLALTVPGIDIIVGGHSHTLLEEPLNVNGTLIVQAKKHSFYVGDLQVAIDPESKKIVSYKNKLLPVNTQKITPDPEIEKIITPVIEEAKKKKAEIVGLTEVNMTHPKHTCIESIMGNIVTDGMREFTGSDIAMMNSGGIRDEILKGTVTFGELYRVLPFDDTVTTVDMTGKNLKSLLENSAKRVEGNLQVSGMTMTIDPKKPEGEKVVEVKVNGKPLEPDKTYSITLGVFLATGGDGYTEFNNATNLKEYDKEVLGTLKDYFEKHSPVTEENAKIEGRIKFLNPPPQPLNVD